MAVFVNISRTGSRASTEEEIRFAAASWWVLSEESQEIYADYLFGVHRNIVVGAWTIDDVSRRGGDGRVLFEVSPAPAELARFVGQPSPEQWTQGQGNPVRLEHTAKMLGEPARVQYFNRQGNPVATVNGWTLTVYPDGRAKVAPEKGHRIVVVSAFPGPDRASVTVRVDQ